MKAIFGSLFFLLNLALPSTSIAAISAGVAKVDMTPPIGTPSAGYTERNGAGMQGVHDPLLAIALFISNENKNVVLCSVDHLGFTFEMVQKISQKVHGITELADCEIYIASSHTHSGGGAYLNIPVLGESLAGAYNSEITQFYIEKTAEAIIEAYRNRVPAKLGIGYGKASNLSQYRGKWPQNLLPLPDITLIKVTRRDDTPLAALFNYPVHPTLLTSHNRLFSADFVGYVRDQLQAYLGHNSQALYFNGAQGDIVPIILNKEDRYESCKRFAESLSATIKSIWDKTDVSDILLIATQKKSYVFKPQPTPFGLILPIDVYKSEINLLVLNQSHAFITIPGELSTAYDRHLKCLGKELGFSHLSIFGLTNDAHGYIILPDSWRHKTFESALSFGGENYGEVTEKRIEMLLKAQAASETTLQRF